MKHFERIIELEKEIGYEREKIAQAAHAYIRERKRREKRVKKYQDELRRMKNGI